MSSLLQDLITARVEQHPDAAAIVSSDATVTYAELEARSNQVARMLREHGCRRGDRIAVLSPATSAAVVATLGILKADAICVPLDPADSVAAQVAAVQLVRPAGLLLARSSASQVDQLLRAGAIGTAALFGALERDRVAGQLFATAFALKDLDKLSKRAPAARNRATNPAWVQFRREGTGLPLGVVATHSGLARSLVWSATHFGVRPGDRHAAVSPLAGVRSVHETLGAFVGGATLFPVPSAVNGQPRRLADFVRRSGLTMWLTSADALTALASADVVAPADFPALRHVVWADGTIGRAALHYWVTRVKHVEFTSLYGVPEATIASAFYTWPKDELPAADMAPVGTPCPGREVLVLNDQLQLAAAAETGDIWIRGAGLSPGYWADPLATDSAFKQGPGGGSRGERMCKTGDRGHRDHLGRIFLGAAAVPGLTPDTGSSNGRAVA